MQAALLNLIPARSAVKEVVQPAFLEEQVLQKLKKAFFSGVSFLYRGNDTAGFLIHLSGRLSYVLLDEYRGRAALEALRADRSITHFTAKRVAHPILVAATSLVDGELLGSWGQPTPEHITALTGSLPPTFTGTLAWVGAQPHVCVYHGGRLFTESLLPELSNAGPLLQLAARPGKPHDLLEPDPLSSPETRILRDPLPNLQTVSAPPTEFFPTGAGLAPDLHIVAPRPTLGGDLEVTGTELGQRGVGQPDVEQVWQATFEVCEQRLGRAARPATEKMQKDLAGSDSAAVLAAVKDRLRAMFGAEAVSSLEEKLGG